MDIAELNRLAKKGSSSTSFFDAIGIAIVMLLAMVFFVVPMTIYAVWAYAFVGKTLWGWFVVTTFGLPPLSMAKAWGLSILVSMWTYNHHVCKSEDERSTAAKIAEIVILLSRPWLILLMGYIAMRLMGS